MANTDGNIPTFDRLWRDQNWSQIANCPGRFRLEDGLSDVAPAGLIGADVETRRHEVSSCRDAVLVTQLDGGGLISYARPNGTYVHTLNTEEGFMRKLRQLGIG